MNDSVAIILDDFSWTARPPAWVVERWNRMDPDSLPRNIAWRVNSWFKRHGPPLSSGSPRERLDGSCVGRRVEAGRMNETLYTRVIDHRARQLRPWCLW